MRKSTLLIIFATVIFSFVASNISVGQVLLDENFSYPAGDLITSWGWTAHSGGGTQPITVNNGGLTFTGYIDSGIGNAALVDNTGEDDNKTFTVQTSGVVYVAFMVNVTTTAAGYFFHLGGSPIGTIFRGKVFMDATNHFGVSVGSNTGTFATSTYNLGTTYLLVLKYEIVSGTTNDIVSLFIFDTSVPSTEPVTPAIGPLTDATQSDINPACVAIRQFLATQNLLIDGIRVGLTWADVIPPLTTPSLSTTVSTLTGFQYVLGAGPSVSQTYNLSGSNLTPASGNLTVTGTTHFEVSTNNTSFFNSVTIPYAGSALSPTPVYVRLMAGLPLGTYNNEIVANSGGGATTVNVTCSGAVVKAEPTNHATGFAAATGVPSYSTINATWTDATGGTAPDGYLVKSATGGYASIVDPVDGTPEPDATLVKNIAQGIQTAAFTGLLDNTPYYFKIYPYTNSGGFINYKTNGTVPTATATTTLSPSITYTWIGADGGDWTIPANWTPTRNTPGINDILIFTGGGTKTVINVPTQTVGKIVFSANTTINLQSAAAATLTILGVVGADLDIPPGCALNLNTANAITIALATTATASINGNMTFSSTVATPHRLTAVDPNAITFNSGAIFTAGTFFSGNAFGNGTASSVIFANGSTYVHQAGSNPFVNNPPNSITVFQTGSLYKLISNSTPSFSGKTYANFEMDATAITVTTTGGSAVTMDNLTVTNGTLNFNMTGTPGHSIKGNILVATGGTLNFAPASAGTVILNGTASQSISGIGIITNSANSTLEISNASGVNLNTSNVTLNGSLKLTNGLLTLGSNNLLLGTTGNITGTPSAIAMIVATGTGQLQKGYASGFTGSFLYPVGDNTGTAEYSPVTLNFTGGTFGTGNYAGVNLVNAKYPADPNTGSYLKRYWALSQSGITGFSCNATFQYVTADVNGTESQIYCMKVLPLPFISYDPANTTLHQLTANGLTSFGTFTGTQPLMPIVSTTTPVINITHISATGGGNVTSDGGSPITARGVCYSTTPNPTIAGPHTTEPGTTGVFTSDITGLTPQTTYYLKAYATNMVGTSYGAQTSFTTLCEPLIPLIDFYADKVNIMVGESVNFFDQSLYCPTSWAWQFVGGVPNTSTQKNPTGIVYNYPGVFNVCLMATNNYGSGIGCKMGYITVTAPPAPLNAKIVITEIMYNPPETNIDSLEFIELFNNDTAAMNMENFYFKNGVIFTFPNVTMPSHSYLIVAKSDTAMFNTFGVYTLKWTDGSLNNGGESIVLYDREGFMVDSVNYDDALPWDTLADARGPSLELCDPDSDNNDPLNWRAAIEFAAINTAGDTIWATPMTGCSYPPVADFVASDTAILQYESVTFTDSSSANSSAWFWTFEGGTPDTYTGQTPPPIHYNSMGAFDVTLKVFNIAGQNTLVKSDYIEVGTSGNALIKDPEGLRIYPNPTNGKSMEILRQL
jgi:PKD repeat protein